MKMFHFYRQNKLYLLPYPIRLYGAFISGAYVVGLKCKSHNLTFNTFKSLNQLYIERKQIKVKFA